MKIENFEKWNILKKNQGGILIFLNFFYFWLTFRSTRNLLASGGESKRLVILGWSLNFPRESEFEFFRDQKIWSDRWKFQISSLHQTNKITIYLEITKISMKFEKKNNNGNFGFNYKSQKMHKTSTQIDWERVGEVANYLGAIQKVRNRKISIKFEKKKLIIKNL